MVVMYSRFVPSWTKCFGFAEDEDEELLELEIEELLEDDELIEIEELLEDEE